MSNERDDGGSAFPRVESAQVGSQGEYHTEVFSAGGMTLRDYFAAEALEGQLNAFSNQKCVEASLKNAIETGRTPKEQVAIAAYEYADAMLRARQA